MPTRKLVTEQIEVEGKIFPAPLSSSPLTHPQHQHVHSKTALHTSSSLIPDCSRYVWLTCLASTRTPCQAEGTDHFRDSSSGPLRAEKDSIVSECVCVCDVSSKAQPPLNVFKASPGKKGSRIRAKAKAGLPAWV